MIEETIKKLKSFGDGAHAHTANKCACYIESFNEKNNSVQISKLIELANNSMSSGDWKKLSKYMARWF